MVWSVRTICKNIHHGYLDINQIRSHNGAIMLRKFQGQDYGQLLMVEAMKKTLLVAENIGLIGFFVDAKHPAARTYYEQFGFISFCHEPLEMFLPLATLRAAIDT